MRKNRLVRFALPMLLIAVLFLTQAAAEDFLSSITILPRPRMLEKTASDQQALLEKAAQMTAARRDALVREGDAVGRGIGIFVAEQQQDFRALLSYSALLEDHSPTLPYAQPTAMREQFGEREQSVCEYLSAAYLEWFGVSVGCSSKRYEKLFGEMKDPNHLLNPWIVKLRRAAGDGAKTAKIKAQIQALPETVRWAVLAMGFQDSLYSKSEAADLLQKLSAKTRQDILTKDDLLSSEPLFRQNDGAFRKVLRDLSRSLLKEAGGSSE